jgi:hypothetical protein
MPLLRPSVSSVASVLVVLFLATAALSPLLGVPVFGTQFAYDSGFAIVSLGEFARELREGTLWPRWLYGGNFGLGSPTFYFYPPLPYWLAAGIGEAGGLNAPASLAWAVAFWRLLALGTTWLWLRATHGPGPALAGAALAALFPYASVVNPWFRFAYAEVAAAALLPLLLLATDRAAATRGLRGVAGMALAYAALAITHLPTTILAVPFGLLYAFGRGGPGLVVRSGLGGAIGAALAGAFLVPALGLIDAAYPAGLYAFVGWPRPLFAEIPWDEKRYLLPIWMAWILGVAALAWLWRDRIRALRWREAGPGQAALLLFAAAALATTPLAWPIWMPGSPLYSVQFPWRTLLFMGPALGALAALALAQAVPPRRALLAGVVFLAPFLLLAANILFGNPAWPRLLPSADHEAWARAHTSSYPAEHWPAAAVEAGWLDKELGPHSGRGWPVSRVQDLPAEPLWRHPLPVLPEGARRIPGGWLIPDAGPEPFALPQLWFPSWSAASAEGPVELRASPATGFVEVRPDGRRLRDLRVTVTQTAAERLGWQVSAVGAVLLLGVALVALRSRQRTLRQQRAYDALAQRARG